MFRLIPDSEVTNLTQSKPSIQSELYVKTRVALVCFKENFFLLMIFLQECENCLLFSFSSPPPALVFGLFMSSMVKLYISM